VSVARLRTNQVFVVGDVVRPGSYLVSGAGTVLTALYAAGGPTVNGSLRRVEVRRGSRVIDSLDVYDYLLRGDSRHDVRLETGDVVFVPVRGMHVRIGGEILRPRIYELRAGESLRDLVAMAGGFRASALRRIQIDRVLPPARRLPGGRDRVVLDLPPEQFAGGMAPAFPLEPDDEVMVFGVAGRRRDFVTVRGNVWTEGRVGYTPGMRLSDALRVAGGPKSDTYLGQILVSRLNADSTRTQFRSAFRDSTGSLTDDLSLREDDEIVVFSRTAVRPDRYVALTGAVRLPGRVPYREGMTLRDALLLAGGVREDAWLQEAEIARLPADRAAGQLAVTIRVPLDSTYLVDRGPEGRYLGPPGEPASRAGAPAVPLQPYDNVLIFRQPDWELQRTVVITGQVRFPGAYALKTRTERITDLVRRAGGLTPVAHPQGLAFYRAAGAPRPTPPSGLSGPRARVGIDFPRVLRDSTFRDNVILAAGDSLNVPEFDPVVRVTGAVNAPTGVMYVPGKHLGYYVEAAGGYHRLADRGRAYAEQPNGQLESVKRRFLFPNSEPVPQPGAVVTVPERDPNDKPNWPGILGAIASAITGAVTIIVVLATR
jgi:protein involved in polysaccharide export with SLBB domain